MRRHIRTTLAVVSAAAIGVIASATYAGGIPLQVPVEDGRADTPLHLESPSDFADYKFTLQAGADYFVGLGTSSTYAQGVVYDPVGNQILTFHGSTGEVGNAGTELHPRVDGQYTLRVSADPQNYYPLDGRVWVWPDCRGGPATRCTVAPGKVKAGTFGGSNDADSFVIKARAGRRYAATLHIETYFARFYLLNGRGQIVAMQTTGTGAARKNTATLKFVLPSAGGPFLLKAESTPVRDSGLGSYTLGLVAQ